MAKAKKSQKSEVLRYMQTHKGITSYQAINLFGATRLSDIIFRLRKEGYEISTEDVVGKNRYGHTVVYTRYSLAK